jgi:hypothetical protein
VIGISCYLLTTDTHGPWLNRLRPDEISTAAISLDRQDLLDLLGFYYSLFPDETKNTQSPAARQSQFFDVEIKQRKAGYPLRCPCAYSRLG